jgi:hypothetical protein
MGDFKPIRCVGVCGKVYERHPGHLYPFRYMGGHKWLCWWCDRLMSGSVRVNEAGGPTQMRLDIEHA